MATKQPLPATSLSCKSQKTLLCSSIRCSKLVSKNSHLSPQFCLFQKRRRQKRLGAEPASAGGEGREKQSVLSSGWGWGARGRREPLFTLASVLHTSHGPVPSDTDLLRDWHRKPVRSEAASPGAPRGPCPNSSHRSHSVPARHRLCQPIARGAEDRGAGPGGWIWKAPRHQTHSDSSHQTSPRFNCPKISSRSKVVTAVIASELRSLASCQF